MSDDDRFDHQALQARTALARLHYPIVEGIERGLATAHEYFNGREYDPLLHAYFVRDHVAETLRVQEASLGFKLTRGPMAGLEVECAGYVSKVWKKHPEALLQAPGESQLRQEFLRQPVQVMIGFPRIETWVRRLTKVVHVWSADGGVVRLWLVCPKNFDENDLWRPGESHWEIPIDHPAETLEPVVDFAGDDDEDLPINLDAASDLDPDDRQ